MRLRAWMPNNTVSSPGVRPRCRLGLGSVADWSAQNCARVMCVEFGVYRPNCPADSAVRWATDLRTWLEAHRISWSYWSYNTQQFVLAAPQPGPVIDPDLGAALGLAP